MNAKRISISRVLIALLGLTMTGLSARPLIAGELEEKKHLDWDSTDKVWRCVGSPVNCADDDSTEN